MNDILTESEKWLEAFLPKTSVVQKKIFSEWIRLNSKKLVKESSQSSDLLRKAFVFFFSYDFTMRSPFEIPEIQKAVGLLKDAVENKKKKIIFYGDRDADGICSLAIFYLFFRDRLGYPQEKLTALLPGEDDKYGITMGVAERIISHEPDILITLDCGSSNKVELQLIKEKLHVQVIVIDHHFIPEKKAGYPEIEAFINPKRLKSSDPNRDLCTSGLSLKLIWALTYSFTREYQTAYCYTRHESQEMLYFKNLLRINKEEFLEANVQRKIVFDPNPGHKEAKAEGSNSDLGLRSLWNATSHLDRFFNRIDRFLRVYPDLISDEEKIRLLLQANLKKLNEKLRPFLAFSAIGTIADMVPLTNDNRVLVSEGIEFINENLRLSKRPDFLEGIFALLQTMFSQQQKITEEDLAFSICPAINAAGRLGNASMALKVLFEKDRLSAVKIAFDLKNLNEDRKKISYEAFENIKDRLGSQEEKSLVIVYDPEIHRGISGLLANRLSNRYKKPALVMVNDGDSIRGSIRAYKNENVFLFIQKLSSYLIQHGGHKQAAGFSIEYSLKDEFIREAEKASLDFFKPQKRSSTNTTENSSLEVIHGAQEDSFKAIELYDHELRTSLWEDCQIFAPFGKGNPHPILAIRMTQPIEKTPFGKTNDHLKIKMKALNTDRVEGIWFFYNNEFECLDKEYHSYKILAEPCINDYQGRRSYRLNVKKIVPIVSE